MTQTLARAPDRATLLSRYGGRAPRYTSYPTAAQFTPAIDADAYGALALGAADDQAGLALRPRPLLRPPLLVLRLQRARGASVLRRSATMSGWSATSSPWSRRVCRRGSAPTACIWAAARRTCCRWTTSPPSSAPSGTCSTCSRARDRRRARSFATDPPVGAGRRLPRPDPRQPRRAGPVARRAGGGEPARAVRGGRPRRRLAARDRRPFAQSRPDVRPAPANARPTCWARWTSVLTLAPERLALFGYAHVPWMKPHQKLIDASTLPGEAERIEQSEAAAERLAAAGYVRVGLDHYAREDDELAWAAKHARLHRNFQGYTTDEAETLIGVGASAIGRLPQGYRAEHRRRGRMAQGGGGRRPAHRPRRRAERRRPLPRRRSSSG